MNPEVKRIIKDVSEGMNVSRSEIMGRVRMRRIVEARWICWYALYLRGYSMTEIAGIWNVNHTAVVHAKQRLSFWINTRETHTKHVVKNIAHLLSINALRYRYKVALHGDVLVESSRPLQPASIRERALAEVDRGECTFVVASTDASEIKPQLEEAA